MLALTPAAVAVVNSIISAPGLPSGAGLRISSDTDAEDRLVIEVTSTPAEDDQVLDETGARVFLAPDAASYLADKVLDASVDDQGGAQFLLGAKSPNGDTPR
ncbi:Fe-S cluster assembly protein HesB [Actinocrispum wychmicini]|uniref:Fe-S cluster assembly iron-binding protein IscA n=1 Tax=Actinocrispum wychmicini TaxID=1213861 RepID=A0A4R2IK57_9PSEU|nr:Fe-S cluster assembly protein HesB [Actinocrispum wychmicini]TCO45363.1 Fe-S cluster assembly iron-binding protein IscA [Actinocrispum wychmicini]